MNILDLPSEILYHILHKFLNDNIINGIINNNNNSIYHPIYTTFEKYNIITCVCKKFRSIISLININIIHTEIKKIIHPENIKSHIFIYNYKYATYYLQILIDAIASQQYDTYIIYTYNSKNIKWNINLDDTFYLHDDAKANVFIVDIYTNKIILNFTLNKVPTYIINYDNIDYPNKYIKGVSKGKKYILPYCNWHFVYGYDNIGCDGYVSLNERTYMTHKLNIKHISGIKFITSCDVTHKLNIKY